ncbi:MAG TPA: M17 family peptidase N-terminal domain-containing protein [Myxococcaceae bacterium]|nr:M17 family peptidase N-terminal domain-containing protein [Myxococcaceae bacterium]
MNVTAHEIGMETLDALDGIDALCLFVGEDERPLRGTAGYVDWRMCGALSRVLQDGFFTGAQNDSLLLPTSGRFPMWRIFVIGLGRKQALTPDVLARALGKAAETLQRAQVQSVALEIPGEGVLEDGLRARALTARFLPAFSSQSRVAVLGGEAIARLLPQPR